MIPPVYFSFVFAPPSHNAASLVSGVISPLATALVPLRALSVLPDVKIRRVRDALSASPRYAVKLLLMARPSLVISRVQPGKLAPRLFPPHPNLSIVELSALAFCQCRFREISTRSRRCLLRSRIQSREFSALFVTD